jgi:GNAT superfamily N-acetyltransferase
MLGDDERTGMATQENTLEIIRASIKDLELVVPLFDGYRQFYKQASDLEGARRFLKNHFEENTSVIFLAFRTDTQGQRQACGFTQLYPSFSSVSMKRLWILNDLFVVSTARRSGAGTALLERARQFAVETGAKGLSLTTAVDNSTAQSVYEAHGWKRDQEFYAYHLLV